MNRFIGYLTKLNITLLLIVPLEITLHLSTQSTSNSLQYPFPGIGFIAQEL
jgi:hypothetical protein